MSLPAESVSPGIGSARIDPEAEPRGIPVSAVSGQKEEQFFAESKNKHELNVMKHKAGWLGRVFGSASEAPTNIAGFLIICSLAVIVACTFAPSTPAIDETRKWALGLVTLIIGYLFGSGTKKE